MREETQLPLRDPEKVVTEAIDHRKLNLLNKRFAMASQQTNVYVVLLL